MRFLVRETEHKFSDSNSALRIQINQVCALINAKTTLFYVSSDVFLALCCQQRN